MSLNPAQQPAVQLLELGAHFALAERAAGIGYWRHQLTDGTVHWSPGFYTMLGLDPAEVSPASQFLLERIHPEDRMPIATAVAEAIKGRKPFHYRSRSWNADEPERTFDTHGDIQCDETGKVVAVIGVVREVTAEVEAQRTIKDREAAYRFVAEEATDMIIRHGKDGAFLFASPAVKSLLGCEPETFLNEPPYTRVHSDDLAMVQRVLLEARDNRKTATLTYRMRHNDGRYIWCETRVRFVFDQATDAHLGAISISRDITEHKDFEEALHAARERAEFASHTKSRFLANMSHELRTPLNAIIGFSDILAREMFGPIGNDRYTDYARLINESGGLLLDLINDLLDMSKIEAGKFDLYPEDFSVGDTIAGCVRLLSMRADSRGVTLTTRVEPAGLRLFADPRAFKQILLNLVSNAVKFTDAGGRIEIAAAIAGERMQLTVADTGVGIPADILPRLARPFEQATNDPARAHGGSGLGLALVKSLTQLHGGNFTLESKLGHGTTVTVTLPLRTPNTQRAA
ncbi:MAG: PAS domain-containing sensor histidine kinase [Micropepsaceae bacterium]